MHDSKHNHARPKHFLREAVYLEQVKPVIPHIWGCSPSPGISSGGRPVASWCLGDISPFLVAMSSLGLIQSFLLRAFLSLLLFSQVSTIHFLSGFRIHVAGEL